ncbi:MAG: PilZ domain-containing protein [Anaerolineales bacterium]|nr:PilZ domain-containing protein [Anaerolineales bacterium]
MPERRKLNRREFSDYLRLMNENTGELVGHLSDISTGGFKMESKNPISANLDFLLRMDNISAVADKDHLVFSARSRWCRPDSTDPALYNVGFQLIDIAPEDIEIFFRIFEKYGSNVKNNKKNLDYLWK